MDVIEPFTIFKRNRKNKIFIFSFISDKQQKKQTQI